MAQSEHYATKDLGSDDREPIDQWQQTIGYGRPSLGHERCPLRRRSDGRLQGEYHLRPPKLTRVVSHRATE